MYIEREKRGERETRVIVTTHTVRSIFAVALVKINGGIESTNPPSFLATPAIETQFPFELQPSAHSFSDSTPIFLLHRSHHHRRRISTLCTQPSHSVSVSVIPIHTHNPIAFVFRRASNFVLWNSRRLLAIVYQKHLLLFWKLELFTGKR